MARLYRAKEAFVAPVEGVDVTFTRDTFVEEGSAVLEAYPHLFEVIEPHFSAPADKKRSVESATAAPGEKRKK